MGITKHDFSYDQDDEATVGYGRLRQATPPWSRNRGNREPEATGGYGRIWKVNRSYLKPEATGGSWGLLRPGAEIGAILGTGGGGKLQEAMGGDPALEPKSKPPGPSLENQVGTPKSKLCLRKK